MAEQLTLNQRVVGSSPTRCTKPEATYSGGFCRSRAYAVFNRWPTGLRASLFECEWLKLRMVSGRKYASLVAYLLNGERSGRAIGNQSNTVLKNVGENHESDHLHTV